MGTVDGLGKTVPRRKGGWPLTGRGNTDQAPRVAGTQIGGEKKPSRLGVLPSTCRGKGRPAAWVCCTQLVGEQDSQPHGCAALTLSRNSIPSRMGVLRLTPRDKRHHPPLLNAPQRREHPTNAQPVLLFPLLFILLVLLFLLVLLVLFFLFPLFLFFL